MDIPSTKNNLISLEVILPTLGKTANLKLPKTTPLEGIVVALSKNLYLNLTNLKSVFEVGGKVLDQRKCLDEQSVLGPEAFKENKLTIEITFQSLGA